MMFFNVLTLISSISAPHFSKSILLIATFSPVTKYTAAITTAVAPYPNNSNKKLILNKILK